MKILKSFMVLGVILLVSAGAYAQDQTGSIFGTVTTEDGAAIVGAKVTASSPALIRPIITRTNERGSYVFPALPVGKYSLTFMADQYQSIKLADLNVGVGSQMRIAQKMQTGVVGEEVVTITGEAPLVDVKSSDTSMNISKELFNALPKGRNFTSIVALAPGANDESDQFGGLMIDGASSSENVWVIDGAGTNDLIGGRNAQGAVFEFVEEIQVRSGGYEAEFGGSMGGVVNVVTRSGGNEFHGSGNVYWENDMLNADGNPSLQINPFDGETAEYFSGEQDEYNRVDVGGSLGGYVMKDRIWFFGSYMPWFDQRDRVNNFSNDGVDFTPYNFKYTRRQHNAAIKVSAQLTDKLRASGSWSTDWYQRGDSTNLPGRNSRTGTPELYDDEVTNTFPGWYVAGNIDYMVSDSFYTNAKFGYHSTNHTIEGVEPAGMARYRHSRLGTYFDIPGNTPSQYADVSPFFSNVSWTQLNLLEEDFSEQTNGSFDGTYFTEAGGSHMLKAGFQYYWIHNRVKNGNTNQYYYFFWRPEGVLYTHDITGEQGRGEYGYYRVLSYDDGFYGLDGESSSYRYALFLQDSWGVNDRLTVNVGVRAEQEHLPSYNENFEDPLQFGFADKLAPRIGASYDLFGDGTMKVYGNWGIYYDVMKLEMAREGYGGRLWKDAWYTLDTQEWWTFPDVIDPSQYPGTPIGPPVNHRIPANDTTDPETSPMEMWEYIAGFDWQFADNMAIDIRFVYKTLKKTIEDIGIITPEGELYWHGNPGFGKSAEILAENGYPNVEAVRDYAAVDMRFIRRFANNWTGGVNLTIGKLRGNYSGLTNTDEDDRDSPNVNRNFDLWWMTFDGDWNENISALQSDRRYTSTIFGSYHFNSGWLDGLVIGANQIINDGTPFTTEIDLNNIQGYWPFGRSDGGRHDMITRTDLYAEYNFRIAEKYTAQVNLNITNLFNQDGELQRYRLYNRDGVALTDDELLDLYNSRTPINFDELVGPGTGARVDPRFGMSRYFQAPFSARLGFKFIF